MTLKEFLLTQKEHVTYRNMANLSGTIFNCSLLDKAEKEEAFNDYLDSIKIEGSATISDGITAFALVKKDDTCSRYIVNTNSIVTEELIKTFDL